MTALTLDREMAYYLAKEAADRAMRKAGRTAWNIDDANAAGAEFLRLWPLRNDYPWMTAAQAQHAQREMGWTEP